MVRDISAYVYGVIDACDSIAAIIAGISLKSFVASREKRSAVEREFIIIGEATSTLAKFCPEYFKRRMTSRSIILTLNGQNVDECHRSIYSLWSQVLDYFDATIIGLTATPGGHTYAYFRQNVVSEYRHEEAVGDKVNVPFWVYQVRTLVGDQGATVEAGPELG